MYHKSIQDAAHFEQYQMCTITECMCKSVDASEAPTGHLDIDSAMPVVESKKIEEKVFEVILMPKHTGLHDVIVKSNSSVVVEGNPLGHEERFYPIFKGELAAYACRVIL